MKSRTSAMLGIALLAAGTLWGCASTKAGKEGLDIDVINREEIMATGATNLYDVVTRLRPRWINIRTTRSFNLESEIVVFQNDMYLGTIESLRQIGPELAYELRWLDGARASSLLPGLSSGRHVEGAIIVSTRPPGGD